MRKIIKDYNFKLKTRTLLDKRRLVDDTDYKPYEVLVRKMLEMGEINLAELNARGRMLASVPATSDKPLSILNCKGIDKYDVDNAILDVQQKVIEVHKKASKDFQDIIEKNNEEYYKNKYSKKDDKDNKPE